MSNQVPIPPTTQYTVVFPLNVWAKQYDSSFYTPGLTDGRAQNVEIDQVLREVERIRKPFNTKIVCALWLYILGLLGCVCLMVVVPITTSGDGYWDGYTWVEYDNTSAIVGSIVGGILGIFFVMIVFIVYVTRVTKASRVPVQNYFNQVNANFSSRGLRWHIPVHFPRWVELWKDYVGQQGYAGVGQPTYLPPQQYQQPYGAPTGVPTGAPTGAPTNTYQMPGTQPQDYQNYGQPQAYPNYAQQNYTEGQQNFGNYNTTNQA